MTNKVITSKFQYDSEAYEALSELRREPVTETYVISQAVILQRVNGVITTKDAFDTGVESKNDRIMGGLLGSMIGILGGPLGMLLAGGVGYVAGSIKDGADIVENASIVEKVAGYIQEGETALIILTQERNERIEDTLVQNLAKYHVQVAVDDAKALSEEIEAAKKLEKEMAKQAREQLRREKRNARKDDEDM